MLSDKTDWLKLIEDLTLDTLGQVAKIEDVVRLGGRRQEVGTHAAVRLVGRRHYRLGARPHRMRKLREESVQYCLKQRRTFGSTSHHSPVLDTSVGCRS